MAIYKSPIKVIYGQLQTKFEDDVVKAVQSYDINVDKDELIKALAYDRGQYTAGYSAGYADAMATIVRCGECIHRGNLQACDGRPLDWYCPNGVRKGEGE